MQQKELLKCHFKLNLINMEWCKTLMRPQENQQPVIPTRHKNTSSCDSPKCASCLFSKAHKRSTQVQQIRIKRQKDGVIKAGST